MERDKRGFGVRGVMLGILIVALVTLYAYYFVNVKSSHHGDECWSYGYSNGYYYGLIYTDDDNNTINQNQWLGGDFYKGYLEVQDEHRFSYDSVKYNLYKDVTTSPLYYVILHTICSFFPNTFSWWYGYVINMVAFVLLIIALYGFAKEIIDDNIYVFAVCVVYGLSTGALSCYIYIRPYALMVSFEMVSLWLQAKMFNCKDEKKHLRLALFNMIVVALGTLTHYYFLTLLFFVAAFTDLYYLFRKQWKKLISFSASMLTGVGIGCLIWPKTIRDLLGSGDNYPAMVPFRWDFSYLLDYCMGESIGVGFPIIDLVVVIYVVSAIVFLIILWVIPSFLFRHEAWFHKCKQKFKDTIKKIGIALTKDHVYIWILFVSWLLAIAITAKTSNVFIMGYFANRYVFQMMPCVVVMFGFFVYTVIKTLFKKEKIVYFCFLLTCVISIFAVKLTRPNYYLFRSIGNIALEEYLKDKDVVLVMEENWKISFYSKYLLDADRVYVTSKDMVRNDNFEKEKVEKPGDKLYFVVEECMVSIEQEDGRALIINKQISLEEIIEKLEKKFDVKIEQTNRIFCSGVGYLLLFECK